MSSSNQPTVIKKYANRRLYNTGSSTYVTLEDLAEMVKNGEEFVVQDAKTAEDITRSVLAQIIFDQEQKEGQNLLPAAFLRQVIRFYGDSMQAMIPAYLEQSMNSFAQEQERLREQMTKTFGGMGMGALEEQVRHNMEMFRKATSMFSPFAGAMGMPGEKSKDDTASTSGSTEDSAEDLRALKAQLNEMKRKLDKLG